VPIYAISLLVDFKNQSDRTEANDTEQIVSDNFECQRIVVGGLLIVQKLSDGEIHADEADNGDEGAEYLTDVQLVSKSEVARLQDEQAY